MNSESEKNKNAGSDNPPNIFTGDLPEHDRDRNANGGILSESHEDLEAIAQDGNIIEENESTYQNLRGNKANGFMSDKNPKSDEANLEIEEIDKLGLNEEEKEKASKTERKYNDQRGGSGNYNDAGNQNSPKSQTKLVSHKSEEGHNTEREGNRSKLAARQDSERNYGWNDKNKSQAEDEKHDEERSLLDPENEDEVYSKDMSK